jgi:glutamyl-tRNA(Gln) amidotransferase subunit E
MMVETVDKEIIRQRINIAKGIVKGEVRGAKETGETEFLRPMPGQARMYPETDLPLLRIGRELVNRLKKNLPKLKGEIKDELKRKGLNDEMINLVLDNNKVDEFETLMLVWNRDANLIAKMIILWPNEIASKMKKSYEQIREILTERVFEQVLEKLRDGKINDGDIKRILNEVANGKDVESALAVEKVDDNKLEEEIAKIVKEKPGLRAGGYMGLIIGKLGANVDKRKAMEILNRLVK